MEQLFIKQIPVAWNVTKSQYTSKHLLILLLSFKLYRFIVLYLPYLLRFSESQTQPTIFAVHELNADAKLRPQNSPVVSL